MTTGVASTTSTTTLAAPVPPVQVQDDGWTVSATIALGALVFALFGAFFRLHFRAVRTEANSQEALEIAKANKGRIETLESQSNLHAELMSRFERTMEKIEGKLDRLIELSTTKK